jgi:penicillin-binding protein 2
MKNNDLNLEDILSDKFSEDDLMEIPLTGRIFKIFFILIIIVIFIVLIQFLNISVFKNKIYTQSAFSNITNTNIEKAQRGLIKDRFGENIIENEASFSVFISARDFPKDEDLRKSFLNEISSCLNLDTEKLVEKLKNHDWRLGNLLIKKNISHEKLVNLSSLDIKGINIEPGFFRVPKDEKAFSHLIGYTGLVEKEDLNKNNNLIFQDEIGKTGLEFQYDDYLRGKNGKEIAYMNAKMEIKEKELVIQPEMGKTLNTFIDSEFQEYFYKRLSEQIDFLNAKAGIGLAVNPQNGEILALTNVPSFELNNIASYLDSENNPFFNRAVSGLYSPGSTIKPLVGVAILEEGVVDPQKSFLSTGQLVVPNPYDPDNPSIFKDWKRQGWVNLYSALAKSSNVYFYIVGGGFGDQEGLGISRLNYWWKEFNLDKKTQIDLPNEGIGFLPNSKWKEKKYNEDWRIGDTYNVSIGQGQLLITPLELINYISAIANGGNIYKLRVSQTEEKSLIKKIENIEDSLEEVRLGMKNVVDKEYGTAYYLNSLPFDVAAKTGTSQVANNKTNALFTGYAPYDNPEIAILVLIEDATEGGLNVVPVANDVLAWYYENRLKNNKK